MDHRTLVNLRDVLAGLYFRDPDILHVVRTVGLPPQYVEWDPRPVNTWRSVLEQAEARGKTSEVINLARSENPNIQSLELAARGELLAVETPELPDADWQGPTDEAGLEQLTRGLSTFRPIAFLQRGLTVARPVARVAVAGGRTGSGFLTAGNLLITNHHVIPDHATAIAARAEFNYQQSVDGLDEPFDSYKLEPAAGWATSDIEDNGGDDWTAVRVVDKQNEQGNTVNAAAKWGTLSLVRLPPDTPKVRDEVIIIQHPGGGPKQIAMSHNVVAFADGRRLQYLTDTLEGSSGSPVFDVEWRVVGLHYTAKNVTKATSKRVELRNGGIHINRVIEGLAQNNLL
jgi:V8-like Glu-specific endopeptidase